MLRKILLAGAFAVLASITVNAAGLEDIDLSTVPTCGVRIPGRPS